MSTWECELTSRRDDGSFTWRRVDASEPKGSIPAHFVPDGTKVGSRVMIEATYNMGRLEVTSCELVSPLLEGNAGPSQNQPQAEPNRDPLPGQLRWASVLNPLENPDSEGKTRPVVLVSSNETHWRVMGLTTKNHYEGGGPRTPIPNWSAVGLGKEGYLWGDKLTRITRDSVQGFIGYADEPLVEVIVSLARSDISATEVDELRSVTRPAFRASLPSVAPTTSRVEPVLLTGKGLLDHFQRNDAQVRSDLTEYYLNDRYTGRAFEVYSAMGQPGRFDGNDLAAVMSLGVQVHTHLTTEVIALPGNLLAPFAPGERGVPIWRRSRTDYGPDSSFQTVHETLKGIKNIGGTIASKLMASKFPHAIPVWDRDVHALTGRPDHWWYAWYDTMSDSSLRAHLTKLRDMLGREDISLLRIADVALWMEAQRRKKSLTL